MKPIFVAKDGEEKKELENAYNLLIKDYQIKISGELNIQKYDEEKNFHIFPKEKTSKIEEIVKVTDNLDAGIIKNVVGEYCIVQIAQNKYLIKYRSPDFEKED